MSARMRVGFACAVGLASAGWGVAADAARVAYTNKSTFTVPIRIAEVDRPRIKAIKFYVKAPNGDWTLRDSGDSTTERFSFETHVDGEYQFAFPTVEENKPADVALDKLTPALRVVVDTTAPEIMVRPLSVASGQSYIQCSVRDANADPSTLAAEFEAEDGAWKPLELLAKDTPGVFRTADGTLPKKLRITAKDKAGNPASLTVALAMPAPLADKIASAIPPAPAPSPPIPTSAAWNSKSDAPAGMPVPLSAEPAPALPVPAIEKPMPALNVPEPRVTEKPPQPVVPIEKPAPAPVTPPAAAPITRQLLNVPRCSLAYALDNVGTNPVQRVEAFATRDDGKTWRKIAEDADRTSPIDLTFIEDGLYGVVLVVSTADQPGAAPVAGEQPDWWIEVDTAAPEVKLEAATVGTNEEAGLLILNWSVRDRNLAPDGVEASWAHQADGPWHSIAKGLRSDSQYRWLVPPEVAGKCYLKIEAADRAGNVGRYVTPQAVATSTSKAKARVLGINPAAVRP